MMYVYAALLLHELGKEINEENLKRVLEAAGAQVDEAKIKAVAEALKGVNIEEVIKEAQTSFVAAPVQAQQPAQAEEKKEEKKEEEKKAPSEEELAAGLSSLFGF